MTTVVDRDGSRGMRVAPHSVEAEESVIGAMMISAEASDIALERLQADDFYRPAHQSIFAAISELFNANLPIDTVSVTEALRRSGALERVGGMGFLSALADATFTASNIEHYVGIVDEHALRRRLLRAGGEIGTLATAVDRDITDVLDTAEQTVFGVSDRRVGDGLALIDPLLFPAIEKAEELSQRGSEVTGVPTGFRDLDRMLAGLHPTNLLIVAARPGMGKTALALSIAKNVAVKGEPVAIFSLEMSREEVVTRLLCSQGRIDSQRLRTGRLTEADFSRLSSAASVFYKKPVYVDDSPGLTVTEIRAKCRRLKRRPGLSLVIVDYLQLMNSPGNQENRQQEIATISRNLKNLARELHVPVIAVSQLNRSLESREDKRPRLGDLRECLTADTRIRRSDTGATVTIGEIARSGLRDVPVWSVDPATGRLVPSIMEEAWSTGTKEVHRVTTRSGRTLRATGNHPLLTLDGWRQVGDLAPGARIAVPRRLPPPRQASVMDDDEIVLLAHLVGDGSYVRRQPLRYTSEDPDNHAAVALSANRLFGIAAKVSFLDGSAWQTRLPAPYRLARGRRNPVAAWLDDLGLYGQRSHEKHLPDLVFGLPDDKIRLFLRHLWATDGSVTLRKDTRRCRIYYASTSRALADDVTALLLRLDFQPRLTRVAQGRHRPIWNVDISGVDQQRRFLREIGCHGRRGRIVGNALDALHDVVGNTNVDTIPVEVWQGVQRMMEAQGVSSKELMRRLGLRYFAQGLYASAPSRPRLAMVADVLESDALATLADSDLLWDEIATITPDGTTETFDALVPQIHNFIADELVVHNSGAIEQDSDVVMFIYRHEYYHPEASETKGLAEVHIAKHRQGAVGKIDMTFLPEFTLFADLGRDAAVAL